ncbi:XRE family transcriptional regulator [Metasolibacillus meyeri]|uniref:XRE family transcriptional regulator n=1 Tax=Metasolibacillus meyeri TaxID=1071052 RepID=A0AAW9NVM0_9BACL|nr:XRE family transcriptional regulator [Metasolibacillus meyeri]MEC1178630.1 XRE family transcriptional regulator [Metasolibacillus meyeri]
MNKAFNNQFNPARLKEARLLRGYSITDLAAELDISRQAISQFELGDSVPKLETILNLMSVLNFPRSYFFKPKNEQLIGNTFFRASSKLTKKIKDIQIQKSIYGYEIYNYLSQFVEFPTLNLPKYQYDLGWNKYNIEHLANRLREYWGLGDKPISNMVNLLERNGIIVFSVDTESKAVVDAFYQHRSDRPFIFLGNDKPSAFRRQLDAAHELGHALMHQHVEEWDSLTKEEQKLIEEQAFYFASCFLLPKEAFTKTVTSLSLDHFIDLKTYWRVSAAAMIYRAREIGLMEENRYTSIQKQISMKKMRKSEPLDDMYAVPQPIVMNKAIQTILKHKVKRPEDIILDLSLPQDQIEQLCNLEKGTLNRIDAEPTIKLL